MKNLQIILEKPVLVLIDTWWNVNQEKQAIITMMEQRFNRYMVECESVWLRFRDIIGRCFNRYMVECEYLQL